VKKGEKGGKPRKAYPRVKKDNGDLAKRDEKRGGSCAGIGGMFLVLRIDPTTRVYSSETKSEATDINRRRGKK